MPSDEETESSAPVLTLRPKARLIKLLGEELVSDDLVAIVELVKNAYDADAQHVVVRFEGGTKENPARLVIEDDGHGMTKDTVLGNWLEPGTTAKVDRHSPSGRAYQGSKGIGRFAAAKVAKTLLLETTAVGIGERVAMLLNWAAFDTAGYLDEVAVDYDVEPEDADRHGTSLILEHLNRLAWREQDYQALHGRLSRLISPFGEISEFVIDLQIPGYDVWSGPVEPPDVVSRPRYTLTGDLSVKGVFSGRVVYEDETPETIFKTLAPTNEEIACGPFSVEVRAWDRDREGLGSLASTLQKTVRQIRQTLDEYSGVAIYRDGFRVYPYGEKGNDWLNLDLRSRQNPVMHLANNQIIAAVKISQAANPELKDRSTREGLVINDEYQALQDWFVRVLAELETKRHARRRSEQASDQIPRAQSLFEPFDISEEATVIRDTLGPTHQITELVNRIEVRIASGVQRVQETFSRFVMLAGLGHMVDIVIHEMGSPLSKAMRQIELLQGKREASDAWPPDGDIALQNLARWIQQLQTLRARLNPQTPAKRGRASSFAVADEIADTLKLYQAVIDGQNIHVRQTGDTGLMVTMSRAVLSQILANLVDNSLYWIIWKHGSGQGGRLLITWEKLQNGFSLTVADDGPGIPAENSTAVFEPYFTTKPHGMGLGLHIATILIESYGSILYNPNGPLTGACFTARFERGVGQ